MKTTRYRLVVIMVTSAIAVAAVVASLACGARGVSVQGVWDALWGGGGDDAAVIIGQRLPRTLVGVLAGAALAVAGTLMQGLTRNPLADPGLLGVNAGASLAVLIAITFLHLSSPASFIWFAFAGAGAAATVVYLVGRGVSPAKLTLAGAAVAAGLGSVSLGLLTTSAATLDTYRFWSVGSLAARNLTMVAHVAPFIAAGLLIALASGRRLDLIALGDEVATALGHSVALTRGLAIGATVLLAGAATALAGPVVFVGLVVPHVLRALGITRSTQLVTLAIPAGAAMLLLADVVGRLVASPGEVEVGFVVALIGAPVLMAAARRRTAVL